MQADRIRPVGLACPFPATIVLVPLKTVDLTVKTNVSASWFENGKFSSNVCCRDHTRSSHQARTDVRQDTPVQIWYHQHIKLLRSTHRLHRCVIDNQIIELDLRIFRGSDFCTGSTKQTVAKLHDVRLVDASDLFAVILLGKVECEAGDTFGFRSSYNFESFNNSGNRLMFQTRVLPFSVFL